MLVVTFFVRFRTGIMFYGSPVSLSEPKKELSMQEGTIKWFWEAERMNTLNWSENFKNPLKIFFEHEE